MQEKVSLKNSKNFRIYKKYLGFAGFFHFLVDFLPISVLYFFYKNDADFWLLIVIYNLLAFATQPFLGFIVDKLENKNFYTFFFRVAHDLPRIYSVKKNENIINPNIFS